VLPSISGLAKNVCGFRQLNFRTGALAGCLMAVLMSWPCSAFTLDVVTPQGAPVSGGFRYLVEQDATFAGVPGQQALPGQAISMSFHRSYLPVL